MRKIFLILFVLISYCSFGQFPNNVTTGSPGTGVLTRGRATIDSLLQINSTCFTDTTTANRGRIEEVGGAMIRTCDNVIWLRNTVATRWISLSTGGSRLDSLSFLNDSTLIVCYEDGSCDTIGFTNNNVFQTVNNAFGGCNNLLSGGVVTANDPTATLVFDVTAADYTIGCKAYNTSAAQVTLANGHATLGRFDVIAVDTNETVIVIQGTPSADPQVPQVNFASQLALTTILVPAGATTATQLGITQTVIYDQNLGIAGGEWDGAATSWTIDRDNLSFPFHLTKSALLSGSTISASEFSWVDTDTMRNGQYDVFKFYIRLTDAWVAGQGLDIAFYNGTTKVSNSVIFQNNSYGFDQTVTGSYQQIAIPMANWVFTDSIFFKVVFKPLATPFSSQAYRLDWIQLQGGINQAIGGSSGLYIWNQYSLAQPANYWIKGDAKVEGQFTSPQRITINGTTFYSGSEKIGLNAIASGTEATVFGAYARGTAAGAISIGSQAGLTGGNGKGITISQYGTTSSSTSVNIGGLTNSGTGNVNLGINSTITGNSNVTIGETAQVTGSNDVVIGYNATSSHTNAIVLGRSLSSTTNNQFIIPSTITNVKWGGFGDGSITGTATYLAAWDVDGNFVEYPPGGISGGLLLNANNGLSVSASTTAQLGQSVGAVGNPAILLSHREIPMGDFTLSLNASAAQSNNIFQTKNAAAAIRARITAAASFSNTGGQTASEVFGDGATVGAGTSTAIGNTATIGTSTQSVAIGGNTNIGNGLAGITVVGYATTHTTNNNATLIGNGITSTGRSTGIGTGGTYSGTNNYGVGENVVVGHTYSGALGFGATTTAANQLVLGSDINSGTEGGLNDIYWGEGVLTVSPNNVSLNANSGSGTNIAAGTLSYNASRGTGTGTPGVHIFQVSTALGSGTTLQTLTPRIQINGSGILAYDGVMPTSGAAGDSVVHRRTSDGQFYLKPASGSTYTASELITLSGSDFQFGGTATTDRTATLGANTITFTANSLAGDPAISITSTSTAAASNLQKGLNVSLSGVNANSTQTTYGVYVSNTHTGTNSTNVAGYFIASGSSLSSGLIAQGSTYGVQGTGDVAVRAVGVTHGLQAISTADVAVFAQNSFASTNTVEATLKILRGSSGTVTSGVGTSILMWVQADDGQEARSNELVSKLTTVTAGAQTSEFSIIGVNAGSTRTLMTLGGTGLMTLGVTGTNRGSMAFAGNTSGLVTIQPAAAAGTYTLTLPTALVAGGALTDVAGDGVLSFVVPGGGSLANTSDATSHTVTLTGGTSVQLVEGSNITLTTTGTGANGVVTIASSGGSSTWNGITDPTGAQALTFQVTENSVWTDQNTTADNLTINSSTGTTNSLISLNRTGTALAAGNNIMELISSGANGTNAITATGLNISVTNTNATSGTNKALTLTASGATTANYAIEVTAGQSQFPAGTSTVPSVLIGSGVGMYYSNGTDIGIHSGTIGRAIVGSSGFIVRDGSTAVIDLGNATSLSGTNYFRLKGFAVGTMQLGMETTQQSMIFKGANNAGTDAAGFNMTYQPGAGTGNSTSAGTLIFSTPDATASGTTVQSFTTKFTVGRFGGVWASRNAEVQGADVASVAGAIAVGNDGNAFEITGTNAITLISNLNWQNGAVITLAFTSTATLTDGTANSGTDIGMELAGNTNFVASAGATLTLRLLEIGGTQRWREIARSVQ